MMEVVIKDEMLNYLSSRNLITKRQHAFIQRHSTVTNLLESVHDWNLILQDRHAVDIIYVDFSRAFDSVVHRKLLIKLSNLGIHGDLLCWICAFLTGRKQCVVVENAFSTWVDVISGVPQGSVLGPILFLLFINDITDISDSFTKCSLFADDLKIYSSIDTIADCRSLQIALDRLALWSEIWQLNVNVNKTHVLHIGCKNPNNDYLYNGSFISVSETVCDLGVVVDGCLSFDKHVDSIVRRAYMRIGVLFKGFVSRDINVLRQAYITFIRPILEYASNVWSPYKLKYIRSIEKIQRHFTRRIPELHDLPYSERLAKINLETLELRRLKADLIMYYKILHKLTPLTVEDYFTEAVHNRPTRSSGRTLLDKALTRNKAFDNDFFVRQVSCWNDLPEQIKHATSLWTFKRQLGQTDLTKYLSIRS